jgi:hypothetical protein
MVTAAFSRLGLSCGNDADLGPTHGERYGNQSAPDHPNDIETILAVVLSFISPFVGVKIVKGFATSKLRP